jgi:L-lactate dehydrogenase complex protein LldG
MERNAFLQRIRQAAEQGRAYRVTTRELPDDVGYAGARGDLCEAFGAEVVAVGGEAYLVDDLPAARAMVLQLCRASGAKTALCWQHELLERLDLDGLLCEAQIERSDYASLAPLDPTVQRSTILAADIGITSCDYALAETGTLVMCSRPGQERVASLAPPLYLSIVERSQVLPDLYDAIGKLQALGFDGLPSNVALITGPSKTGDMELELTTGVHGPGRWCVVVVR